MKLLEIARFELGYQARRPWPWVVVAILLLLCALMARDTSLADALYEDFYANSPFAVAKTTVVGGLIWLLSAAFIAGEAGARDMATRIDPLYYTLPIRKGEYLGGRFLAAFLFNAFLLLSVPLGILLGLLLPGIDTEVIGPYRIVAFLNAYAFISIPTAFIATAVGFALAVWSGRPLSAYVGSLLLLCVGFFIATILRFTVSPSVGMLLDPIGINVIVENLSYEWTVIERSHRILALEGVLLWNRLLWIGVGIGVLGLTYTRFRFAHRAERRRRLRLDRRRADVDIPLGDVATSRAISLPAVMPSVGMAIDVRRTLAIAGRSFRAIATSLVGIGVLAVVLLMTIVIVIDQMSILGSPLIPTTVRVLMELTGGLSAGLASEPSRWVIVPLFTIYIAGELVWREREAGMGEIVDTMPGTEWPRLIGTLLGIWLMLTLFMTVLMVAGMIAQLILGYDRFEIGLYLTVLFGLQLPEYLLFALLAVVIHIAVDQKYLGHMAALLAYTVIAVLASMLGIEHDLLVYGHAPAWSYTEMRGFAGSIVPWLCYHLYWASWSLLLLVIARLLWRRGTERAIGARIAEARRRLDRTTTRIGGAAAASILAIGGFLVLDAVLFSDSVSSDEIEERRAEYERRFGRFARTPQPELTDIRLRIAIEPGNGRVAITASSRLVNRTSAPIDSIHLTIPWGGVETEVIAFDRDARLVVDDRTLGYRIYDLSRPIEPGDSALFDVAIRVEQRGIGIGGGAASSIARNGTAFDAATLLPLVGYRRERELVGASERREHRLEPRPVIASLYSVEGREPTIRGGGVRFEAIVSTDNDQIAVAPGMLRRTWKERNRRWFHYATDGAIGEEWTIVSADYEVMEEKSNGVAIRIYHHPEHTAHLAGMMRSVRASLTYYSEQFGPYPYGHLTIVEHPGAPGTGMHAAASMITYGQGVPSWLPLEADGELDFPFAVMSHEMAHQWTLPYAVVEGAPFLSEGLAWYFAIRLVAEARGVGQLRKLLMFMREPHPFQPIRRGEPLLRALDPYLSYRRGPFAMVALSEYVGVDRVNGALRRLIGRHERPGTPPATTLDLYRELQSVTPDSLRPLLRDLFERNSYWRFAAERATATKTADGMWRVTLDVRASKTIYDSTGREREAPIEEPVQIGLFAPPADGGDELSTPIALRMFAIRSGTSRITLTVPQRPARAGIDPYNLIDWEEMEETPNVITVQSERSSSPR